jgi:hypothetical protein
MALLALAGCLLLALGCYCANREQVFVGGGRVHFIDADCYSRMTRVRAVLRHPGEVIRWHEFENYPLGVKPHTTALFDYLTAGFSSFLWMGWGEKALDFAGVWISPLIGLLTAAGLWRWGFGEKRPGSWLMLLVFAASPILAQGFALGRPDHQSLILACMAAALAAEWTQWQAPSRAWGIVGGAGWALGLWTSLYEPLVLLTAVLLGAGMFNRGVFRQRERLPGLALGGVILLAALACEGWRFGVPGGSGGGGEYFAAWSRQIGELGSLPPWSPTIYGWTGLGLLAAPVLLLRAGETESDRPAARAQLWLLGVVFLLTCWQARWGYFLALVYTMSLPAQFGALARRWRPWAGAALVLGLWPMWAEWSGRVIWPSANVRETLAEQREDMTLLREVAGFIAKESAARPPFVTDQGTTVEGVLAPWWLSPALVYWSGQPAVAGSSHESLPGTVDAARFYLSADARASAAVLRARRVRWVVAYEPDRVLKTAADLLGSPPAPRSMDFVLYRRPELAPRYLRLAMVNKYFKVYETQADSLQQP